VFFVIAVLSSVGLPGLNGFVGEFLILAGTFQTHPVAATFAATGVILAAIYLLWLVQKVFFGPITNEENRSIPDMAWHEVAAMVPLVVFMVWIGVHPNTFLKKMEPSVKHLMATINGDVNREVMVASESSSRRVDESSRSRINVASNSLPVRPLEDSKTRRLEDSPRSPQTTSNQQPATSNAPAEVQR
jgi:NADH-quinone oxidoreductase subunit M